MIGRRGGMLRAGLRCTVARRKSAARPGAHVVSAAPTLMRRPFNHCQQPAGPTIVTRGSHIRSVRSAPGRVQGPSVACNAHPVSVTVNIN